MTRFARRPWLAPALLALILLVVGVLGEQVFADTLPAYELRLRSGVGAMLIALGIVIACVVGGMALALSAWRAGVARAVSREREVQREAHRQFLRRLDHEVKNPLTAMRAGLANLAEVVPDSSTRSLENVQRQVDRLNHLAGDLRKLAELEARDNEQTPVDIPALVDEVIDMARAAPAATERTIVGNVQRLPWPPPPVIGDCDLLRLAMFNLVDNALKFSKPGSTVEVRAREDAQDAVVEVADSGSGILAADLPHVTEELYRGQTATPVDGSGLGLALVERVARLHHGRLDISSRPAEGTLISLRLPGANRRSAHPRG